MNDALSDYTWCHDGTIIFCWYVIYTILPGDILLYEKQRPYSSFVCWGESKVL